MLKLGWILLLLIYPAASIRTDPGTIPEVIFSDARCRILINEFNFYTDADQFIEISKYCLAIQKSPRAHTMRSFRLVFINYLGYMIGVCKLDGVLRKPENEKYYYYTIGRGSADFDIDDCEIPSNDPTNPKKRILPKGINYPIGLALVYNERVETLKKIQLQPDGDGYKKVAIDSSLEKLIVKSLIDFYVYGSSTQYVYCQYFGRFYSGFNDVPNPILRDWGDDGGTDVSLSRCGSDDISVLTLPFQRQLWLYTKKTPRSKNACKHGAHFSVEDMPNQKKKSRTDYNGDSYECRAVSENAYNEAGIVSLPSDFQTGVEEILQSASKDGKFGLEVGEQFHMESGELQEPTEAIDTMEDEPICAIPMDGQDITEQCTLDEELEDALDEENTIMDVEEPDEVESRDDPTIEPITEDEFDSILSESTPYMYDNCTHFDHNILDRLDRLEGKPYDAKDILRRDVCNWVEVTTKNFLRCKLCNKLIKQGLVYDRPKSASITKIMTSGVGILSGVKSKYYNRQHIVKHLKNPIHNMSLQFFGKVDEGKKTSQILEEIKSNPGSYLEFYNQTLSMITTVYQAVRLGITFFKFNILVETVKHFGVPLGHLYSNDHGMQTIVSSISSTMHNDVVAYLLKEQPRIALIADEYSDVSTKSILAICFQTLALDKEVKVFLYRLIDLKGNQTGANIFNKFKESIRRDGLESYITENLVGFASDGGANFRQTFRKHLKEYVHNELTAVHCNCHVLERINFHALRQFPDLNMVDRKTNDVFKLFNSHSAKRKTVLEYMIIKQKDSYFQVKRIQTIRWIASKYRALKNVLKHWKTIVEAVRQIMYDKGFEASARLQARAIEDYLLDPIFLATIAFAADVAKVLTDISQAFQKRGFSVILVKEKREKLLRDIESLKAVDGPFLSKLFSDLRIISPEDQTNDAQIDAVSLEREPLTMSGIELNAPRPGSNGTFNEFCSKYVQAIRDQVDNYYPGDVQDSFWILDPMKIEAMVHEGNFQCQELNELNEKLKWGHDDEVLCQSWTKMVQEIVLHGTFQVQKETPPEKFWSTFLTIDGDVGWTDMLHDIVSTAISQPGTSAEVERVFSLYSATKTLRRFSLKVETVEAIIRIRFNGVTSVGSVNPDIFLKDFLQLHSRVDDQSRREKWAHGKKPKPSIPPEYIAGLNYGDDLNGNDDVYN